MFKNFITITLRNILRQKGFSFINLLGLTLGLTVGFMIILYIYDELSYDKFHKDYNRIYRIAVSGKLAEMPLNVAVTPGALGIHLKKDLPEVEEYTMFEHNSGNQLLQVGNEKYYDQHIIYADTNFLRIFNFKLLSGNENGVLAAPYSIVLTESIAKKYFGEKNPIGETIRLNDQDNLIITGVIKDFPQETHLLCNILISFETKVKTRGAQLFDNWSNFTYYNYVKLKPNTDPEEFNLKMTKLVYNYLGEDMNESTIQIKPYLQAVNDIHLHSNLIGEITTNSDYSYIFILSAIAFGILFIAGINFMNLSTARSSSRAKEVSIRKIVGSFRSQLIVQFTIESVLFSLMALVISMALIEVLLPEFNDITGKTISLNYYENSGILFVFLSIALFLGIFSGSYPAFFLSAFKPVKIINSRLRSGSSNKVLRNILVFFQFTISAGLIISTIVIYSQLRFVENKELGFDRNNIFAISLRNNELKRKAKILEDEIRQISGVESTSLSSSVPGMNLTGSSMYPEGYGSDPWMIYRFDVDANFIEKTMGMKIIKGRNFSEDFYTDSSAIIANVTLINELGWQDDPIGKTISNTDNEKEADLEVFHIIGVVEDFHFRSMHEKIEPTIIHYQRNEPEFLIVRSNNKDLKSTMDLIGRKWDYMNPEMPFNYNFIEESFDSFYNSERKLGLLFIYLTVFAIIIASLGILGLSSYTAEQRTKEIGVRKVLGATVFSISKMLTLEYLRLIILANLVSWPISYKLMQIWLQNFYYHSPIPLWSFLVAALLTMVPALIVINIQTIKTASSNPAKALKYE
jgi:putative ABC transport system permease protein